MGGIVHLSVMIIYDMLLSVELLIYIYNGKFDVMTA